MTWNLRVDTHDGESTVTASGEVPDGTITLDGSDDGRSAYLSASQRDAQGRYVVHAQHSHDRQA